MSDTVIDAGNEPLGSDGEFDGFIVVDPVGVSGATAGGRNGSGDADRGSGGTGARRRGRPPGSGGKKSEASATLSGVDIGDLLKGIHLLLAARAGEHWALEDAEAKQLEKAIKRAMRHHDMQVNQKTVDYLMLAYTVGTIYGTRAVTSYTLTKAPKKMQQENVVHLTVPGMGT